MLRALFADTPPGVTAQTAVVAPAPARSVWLAPTYDFLATDAFEPSSRHGFGVRSTYEFHVSPRFNLGLALAYRLYPGETATQQLGYGAVLKHFFSPRWASVDGVYPFLDYGLLLQQSFIEDRKGSAVSHDTRLGGGVLWRLPSVSLFADLAAHYSRLAFFDRESTWIPYLETSAGCVFAF
jgi:hypothetical protein